MEMDSINISPVHTDSRSFSGAVREDGEECHRLEKSNFDLKMKVYYLEESLRKAHEEKSQSQNGDGEVTALKLLLEEKNVELEQRNLLLLKAKGAIEALKGEIQRLKSDSGKSGDLEERVRRLKEANEVAEHEHRSNFLRMEGELISARQALVKKEELKTVAEDKTAQLEVTLALTNQRLSEVLTERARLEERFIAAQDKLKKIEDDLTQSLAHVDIQRMEIHELMNERDDLQNQLQDLHLSKQASEEHMKSRLEAGTEKYESQVRSLQQVHEQNFERLKQEHQQSLESIRQQYQNEIQRARSELEAKLNETRTHDSAEISRVRETFNERFQDKVDEIKVLRSLMEADRSHLDAVMKEMETLKADVKLKMEAIDRYRGDLYVKDEELKGLRNSHDDALELKKVVQRLQDDKSAALQQVDGLSESLNAARDTIEQQQTSLNAADRETQRLSRDLLDFRTKNDRLDEICRENERMRAAAEKNKLEIQSLSHRNSNHERDLSALRSDVAIYEEKIQTLTEELSTSRSQRKLLEKATEDIAEAVQNEKNRVRTAEAALAEQRRVTDSLKDELNGERAARQTAEKSASKGTVAMREIREEIGRSCALSVDAMHQWDAILSQLLDGDLFDSLPTTRSSSTRIKDSPRKRSSRFEEDDDEDSLTMPDRRHGSDFYGKRADLLPEEIAVQVERLNLKFERVSKIRQLFEAQGSKMIKIMQSRVESSQERLTLAFHTIASAQSKADSALAMIERDRKNKANETEEMRRFREEILSEHNTRLRDSELRFAQISEVLEQERRVSAASSKQAEDLRVEVAMLMQSNGDLREDLQSLHQSERIVSELTIRMSELANGTRKTQKELEEKTFMVNELTAANTELAAEKNVLTTTTTRYESVLRSKDEEIKHYQARIDEMAREIEQLRDRQIHPDLEQTIRETQSLLQDRARGGHGGHRVARWNQPSEDLYQGAMDSHVGGQGLALLTSSVETLVLRTGEMIDSFESWHQHASRNQSIPHSVLSAADQISKELFDLLDENSRLTMQLQQLSAEIRRANKRSAFSFADSSSSARAATTSAHHHRSQHRTYSQPLSSDIDGFTHSPLAAGQSETSRASHRDHATHNEFRSNNMREDELSASLGLGSAAAPAAGDYKYRETSYALQPSSTPKQASTVSFGGELDPHFHQAPLTSTELQHSVRSPRHESELSPSQLTTEDDLGEAIQLAQPTASRRSARPAHSTAASIPTYSLSPRPSVSTSSSSLADLRSRVQGQQSQVSSVPFTPRSVPLSPSVSSTKSAATGVSLASRQSTRLNKLGSDLQNLAKKLDAFDTGKAREVSTKSL